MEMKEFIHHYAEAMFLEEREIDNFSKAIANVLCGEGNEDD